MANKLAPKQELFRPSRQGYKKFLSSKADQYLYRIDMENNQEFLQKQIKPSRQSKKYYHISLGKYLL